MGSWKVEEHENNIPIHPFIDPLALGDLQHAGVRGSNSMAPRQASMAENSIVLKAIDAYCRTCDSAAFILALSARRQFINWWRFSSDLTPMNAGALVAKLSDWKTVDEGKAGLMTLRSAFIWLVDMNIENGTSFGVSALDKSPFLIKATTPKHRQRTFRRWFQTMMKYGWIKREDSNLVSFHIEDGISRKILFGG